MNSVIIVAGGKGLRMGGELPKQFIAIGSKPVLMHTIEAFYEYDQQMNIIVVLPSSFRDYWQQLCNENRFEIPHIIADGGESRFHSVKNGLKFVHEGIVAVHDGARPFVSKALISRIFQLANTHSAVIPVTDVTDSLRQINDDNQSNIIDRSKIKQVQTPQVFDYHTLADAYETEYCNTFTDDASVVEHKGTSIHLTQGEITNIKITTPFDLEIAEVILNRHNRP